MTARRGPPRRRGRHRGGDDGSRPARAAWSPATWGSRNTTASAALVCAFTGAAPAAATGRGTGVDDRDLGAQGRRRHPGGRAGCRGRPRPRRRRWPSSPRSAASSTPRWPGSSSARPRTGPRCCSTAPSPARPRSSRAALCPAALEYAFAGHVSHEAGHALALRAPRAAPAAGAGPAPRRGDRRPPGAAAGRQRGPGAARRRHLRLRRGHRQGLTARLPRDASRRGSAGTIAGDRGGARCGRTRSTGVSPAGAARPCAASTSRIHELHQGIADRAFRAVGPAGRPVQVVHDAISGLSYAERAARARGAVPALAGGVAALRANGTRPRRRPRRPGRPGDPQRRARRPGRARGAGARLGDDACAWTDGPCRSSRRPCRRRSPTPAAGSRSSCTA